MTPLHAAVSTSYPTLVEVLLASGADISLTNHNGQTAMDMATAKDNTAIVKLLEQHGAAR